MHCRWSIDLSSLFLSRKSKAHIRISSCLFLITAYLGLGFLNILFPVFQQTGVLYCVYHHFVLKHSAHLMFVSACILKKVSNSPFVPVLFSLGFCCVREEDLHLIVCPPISFLFAFCPRGGFVMYFWSGFFFKKSSDLQSGAL